MGLVTKLSGSDMIIIGGDTYVHFYRKKSANGTSTWRVHVKAPQDVKIEVVNEWCDQRDDADGEETDPL